MAFTYTDYGKTMLHTWGRFRVTLLEAVVAGDLLSFYNTDASYTVQFADDSDSQRADCIACEAGAAGDEIWACLKAECKASTSIGTGGAVTQNYFAASTDFFGAPLYVGDAGKPSSSESATYIQRVGRLLARDRILLDATQDADIIVGGKWRFYSWGTVFDGGSLYIGSGYGAYLNPYATGRLEICATTSVRIYVGGVGLDVTGALTSTAGRMRAGSFQLIGTGSMILGQHADPVTAPADEGSVWYNTTQDKLQFKTAAGIETVTSVAV